MDEIQLKIEDLRIAFRQGTKAMPAVDAVSLELRKGEMLALLGESGSGKSLTALSLLGLLPHPAAQLLGGHAWFDGQDLYMLPEAELRKIRGHRIAMVFQEPMTALNPLMTVGDQLGEVLRTHFEMHGGAIAKRCVELLDEVEIPEAASRLKSYPHELSGGLRQRVMIAMALAGEPEILIADEPTTALDVTVQAQIMRLLTRLQEKHGTAILFITHNLALAAQGAQRCAVMYAGEIVETATAEELFRSPRHPYTRLLLHSLPRSEARGMALETIAGMVPRNWGELTGCRFAERCPLAREECRNAKPTWTEVGTGHFSRCHWAEELSDWRPRGSAATSGRDSGGEKQAVILRTEGLRVWFPVKSGWLHRTTGTLKAVDGVDLELCAGETLALVGESGCGKSTIGRSLIRLVEPTGGRVLLHGFDDVTHLKRSALLPLRREVQMIFQDPFSSLDPRMMAGESVAEGLSLRHPEWNASQREARVAELLKQVGLNPADATRYPHQFSGGQRQRIGLARALAVEPQMIVCDECTSALDVSVQAQILNLLKEIQGATGVAYLFITHDLSVVGYLADRVAVMYLGHLVEEGPAEEIFANPVHPYTQALFAAAPRLQKDDEAGRAGLPCRSRSAKAGARPSQVLSGDVPSPIHPPTGCPFHPRCPHATPQCAAEFPGWRSVGGAHRVRCVGNS